MATRLKTVKYAFPALASLTNNTLTTLTQITVYLPETGTKTFRSVVAHVTFDDIITATGGSITTKTMNLRLGAAGYTSVANANGLTNSGENLSLYLTADFTSHFTTNWTGTSMTCDFQIQLNQSTGTTLGMVNVCVTLDITYEYDDTSTTQIKTVLIPLNMPVGALATTATTYDTIPALDTYLPEASKTYRQTYIVVQGNEARNAATTDHTMTLRVGATNVTTGNYEGALASDRFFRYVWQLTWPDTSTTHTWQPTDTIGRNNHAQAWLVVTYEFNASTTTSVMNSVMLPMEVNSPMGGTTSSDYQRATRELFIQEQNIATSRIAFFVFWQQIAAIGGLNMRIGTGSFVAYTDTASVLCGSNAAMVRNDSAFTLARGRNSLNFNIYRTDTADYGWNICGFWLVNYTSDKHADGVGAHNHTVEWGLSQNGTALPASLVTVSATAPVIPESNYYITAIGNQLIAIPSSGIAPTGFTVQVERLSSGGEGGVKWENAYANICQTDPEIGDFFIYSQAKDLFKRWPNDPDTNRFDLETARRWRIYLTGSTAVAGWYSLSVIFTYHTITYAVAGTVSRYADADGAGLTVNVYRQSTGEKVGSTTTTSGGAYTFTWYDDTENLFTACFEDSTHNGVSPPGLAT
jgi:hypothetical protein